MSNVILQVNNLKKHYPVKEGWFNKSKKYVKAVDGVSFKVNKGETLGVVGESGCGKSTMARAILRLLEQTSGEVLYKGKNTLLFKTKELQEIRKEMQIVFQDPYSSLNPRLTIEQIIKEPLQIHKLGTEKQQKDRVVELIETVGLTMQQLTRYPHEFSGGQRQRIGIARALALNPKLLICDEPVSALDVSIQSQILNLLKKLQKQLGLTYIFIAHDLSVVKHVSDRVAVMYLGKIVEIAGVSQLYNTPQHPYTKALLSAIPQPNPRLKNQRILLNGDMPSPVNPPDGCSFHTRCYECKDQCKVAIPELKVVNDTHKVACHLSK